MSDIDIVERGNVGEILDMEKAVEVGKVLQQHYPNHFWAVGVQGGSLVIKNMAIGANYGMILKHLDAYSASSLAHEAVIKAGELLERAGMVRGKWNGEFATKLEGSDPRFFRGVR